MAVDRAIASAALLVGRTRAGKPRSLHNIICASRPTANAHWPRLRARSAAVHFAPVLPVIEAKSNSAFLRDSGCRHPPLIRDLDRSSWQAFAVACDLAGCGDPQPVAMAQDVANGVAESAQAERLADDEGMHRNRKDQRVFARLVQHLVKLVDNHLGELAAGVAPEDERGRV